MVIIKEMVKLSFLRAKFAVLPEQNRSKDDLILYVRVYVLNIIELVILIDKTNNFVLFIYFRLFKTKEDFYRYA